MWNQLDCPECPAQLGYADVKKYASDTTFQKYDSLTMKDVVCSDPNFRWCTKCISGQVHSDGAESPLIVCDSCRALSCFTHQTPWHEGMTCVEFDNPESIEGVSKSPNAPKSWGLRSSIVEFCDWNREIVVGGVKRKETDQEKNDRKLAMRLFKEQEADERKRLQRIEQEEASRQAQAERRDEERRAREAQVQIERQRQVREAQQVRARQQIEESASSNLVEKNTKTCPGKCGWRIEKNDGCDHMTC